MGTYVRDLLQGLINCGSASPKRWLFTNGRSKNSVAVQSTELDDTPESNAREGAAMLSRASRQSVGLLLPCPLCPLPQEGVVQIRMALPT